MTRAGHTISELSQFFVFNSSYGPKEGQEEEKILFYYPDDITSDKKISEVGLCEAFIKFASGFSKKNIESVHTLKFRKLYLEAEKDFWIVLIVTVPCVTKTENGVITSVDYHDEELQDSLCRALLQRAYNMFKLFMGSFENILEVHKSVDALKQRLNHFYKRYLLTVTPDAADVRDLLGGVHFLPLDKNAFLKVQCFVNTMEATFKTVKCSAFLYQDFLVWCGLEPEDMSIVYYYLTTSLLRVHQEQELLSSESTSGFGALGLGSKSYAGPSSSSTRYGRFVTGPPDLSDIGNMGKIPRVFVNVDGSLVECNLIVYRALRVSICLFCDASVPVTFDMCVKMDKVLGQELTQLASEINEQTVRQANNALLNQDPAFRFVYYNHMNMAQKTSLHAAHLAEGSGVVAGSVSVGHGRRSLSGAGSLAIPMDTMRLLVDLKTELSHSSSDDAEIIAKSVTDSWVIAKKSDHREFYVVVTQRTANLIEINEELKRLCARHFSSIFFLD